MPMNFRYSADEIKYCLELADVEVLVFGPEFIERMDSIADDLPGVGMMFFPGSGGPDYTEDCLKLMGFCSSSAPPVALCEEDYAAIYFSSGTTGFPKAILHNHRSLRSSCETEQNHHGQTREDVFLCIPPLYHTGAKMHWFGSALSGSKAVLFAWREAGMDFKGGYGGTVYHRLASGAMGAGSSGCHRLRQSGYEPLSA